MAYKTNLRPAYEFENVPVVVTLVLNRLGGPHWVSFSRLSLMVFRTSTYFDIAREIRSTQRNSKRFRFVNNTLAGKSYRKVASRSTRCSIRPGRPKFLSIHTLLQRPSDAACHYRSDPEELC
jgi:hypothetical protein